VRVENLINPFAGDNCLLCGGKPLFIGIFVPQNSQLWGASIGKARFVRYCLCEKCKDKSDTPEKVEKVILSGLAGGEATHE